MANVTMIIKKAYFNGSRKNDFRGTLVEDISISWDSEDSRVQEQLLKKCVTGLQLAVGKGKIPLPKTGDMFTFSEIFPEKVKREKREKSAEESVKDAFKRDKIGAINTLLSLLGDSDITEEMREALRHTAGISRMEYESAPKHIPVEVYLEEKKKKEKK